MRKTGGADPQSAFLRVVVVGPSHPRLGEAARHTAALAGTLLDAGHEVTLVTWHPQPLGGHETASATATPGRPSLGWARPDSWWRSGRRLRGADAVVLVHSGIRSLPALLALLRGMGLGAVRSSSGPQVVLVAQDGLEHDAHSTAHRVTTTLVHRCDAVLVHDEEQARVARRLGAARVSVTPAPRSATLASGATTLDSAASGLTTSERLAAGVGRTRGVAPSAVRPGSRWAAPATARVPDVARVRPGPSDDRAGLDDDGPVLPADWARYVGAIEALVAPSAAPPPERVDGDDEARQASSGPISRLSGHSQLSRLTDRGRAAARAASRGLARVAREARAAETPGDAVAGAVAATRDAVLLGVDHGLTSLQTARADHLARRPVTPLRPRDLPEWVRPTDVLTDGEEADDARAAASALGLPRLADGTTAWACLGALAAVVRVVDDGRQTAVIVDESGERSPFTRWARATGFAPVALGLTDPDTAVADVDLDLDIESLDVIVRVHPHGCEADDVDEAVGQASWALRRGGLLIVTVPLGVPGVPGAATLADVRGVVARADAAGLVLVGDLDGDVTARASAAAAEAARAGAATAYGLVRLTFRRG